jgi:hypothetical protein
MITTLFALLSPKPKTPQELLSAAQNTNNTKKGRRLAAEAASQLEAAFSEVSNVAFHISSRTTVTTILCFFISGDGGILSCKIPHGQIALGSAQTSGQPRLLPRPSIVISFRYSQN